MTKAGFVNPIPISRLAVRTRADAVGAGKPASKSICIGVAPPRASLADKIRRRCGLQITEMPASLQAFVDRHENRDRKQLTLRLV